MKTLTKYITEASEILANLEEMFPYYDMHSDMCIS